MHLKDAIWLETSALHANQLKADRSKGNSDWLEFEESLGSNNYWEMNILSSMVDCQDQSSKGESHLLPLPQ